MKRILLAGKCLAMVAMLTCCTSNKPNKPKYIDRGDYRVDSAISSRNQNERVRFLVMHYTAVNDAESLKLLTTGAGSAHYLVPGLPDASDGKPVVLQLVPEDKRAWHAGVSQWNGRGNLNDTSIGIEIVNTGFTEDETGKTWYDFHPRQIELVARLAKDVIRRYQISPDNVVAHSDIAPQRKYDPGPLFPWAQLAQRGVGAWPDKTTVDKYLAGRAPDSPVPVAPLQAALAAYGYTIPQTGQPDEETVRTIGAFQMHYRPADYRGAADAETEAIALALVEKYRG
ncbi:N-acetylmuramoyl-L-alanine amidase [Sodalis sp. RH21]|uniref:N-acetylmuramoyl-L-alanine amidase n=1 Tax=unclassified Sodalis (in: enterobacteria) TaxID=2636512 RepID=UPI0039B4D39A